MRATTTTATLQHLPLLLPRTVPRPPHHYEDRGRILRRRLDQVLDRAAHQVLAELIGEDRLRPLALHRERKAVLQRLRVAERAALLDVVGVLVLRHRLVAERIEVGRSDAGPALDRLILEGGVARLGLVHAGRENGLRLQQRYRGLRAGG